MQSVRYKRGARQTLGMVIQAAYSNVDSWAVFALIFLLYCTAIFGPRPSTTLEATQGQIVSCFSQLPYKYHQNRVASVGD